MKTSYKIFISFLIFLFSGIIALYVGSKYYYYDNLDFLIQDKKTAPFSVVVAEPGAYLVLKNGSQFSVSQSYKKGSVPHFASFVVRNDTLFMSAVKSKKDGQWLIVPEVNCKNVKYIIAKEKTNVNLKNYEVDSLFVKLTKSDFIWHFKKTNFVNIVAKDSYMRLEVGSIKKINVQLDKTQLWIESKKKTNEISGSLINDSYIDNAYKNGAVESKINLKLDKSSNLTLIRN